MNIVIFFCKEKIDQYAVPVMPVFKLDLSIYIVHVVHAHFFGQRENYIIIQSLTLAIFLLWLLTCVSYIVPSLFFIPFIIKLYTMYHDVRIFILACVDFKN